MTSAVWFLLASGLSTAFIHQRAPLSSVLPEFAGHPALEKLDVFRCGSSFRHQPRPCPYARPGNHPWLVALGFQSRRKTRKVVYRCSGVLLTSEIVLTSAKCALGTGKRRLTKARLGDFDLSSANDCDFLVGCENPPLDRDIAGIVAHPDPDEVYNNLGLVRLSEPVQFLDSRRGPIQICLPLFSTTDFPLKEQYALSFSLKKDRGPLTNSSAFCCECNIDREAVSYRMDVLQLENFNQPWTRSSEPCRYRLRNETEIHCVGTGYPCIADFGAPLVTRDRFRRCYHVIGVASRVPRPEKCHNSRVQYASVIPHLGWILDGVEELMA